MKNILTILMLSFCATFIACSDSDDGGGSGSNESVYKPLDGRRVASVKTTNTVNGRNYSWEHRFSYDAQGRIKEINSNFVHYSEYNARYYLCNISSNAKYSYDGNYLNVDYSVTRVYPENTVMNSKDSDTDRGVFNNAGVLTKMELADFVYSGTSLDEAYFESGEKFRIVRERSNVAGYVISDIATDVVKKDFSSKYRYSSFKNKTNFDFSGYFGYWGVEQNMVANRMPYYASYQLAAFGMLGATSPYLPMAVAVYDNDGNVTAYEYGTWELDSKDCPVLYVDPSGRKTVITYVD